MKTSQEGCNWKHIVFISLTQLKHLLIYPNNMLYTKIGLRYKGKSQGNSRNLSFLYLKCIFLLLKCIFLLLSIFNFCF